MVDFEVLKRCLNPVILNLQKMELELKCQTCLKLLDLPIMLPCSHIFCSPCITILTKNRCECPTCKLAFLHQDLRPAGHIKSLVNIYKDMYSAVASTLPHQDSKDRSFPASESPVSGNNYVKVIPQTELAHNLAREKLSDPHLHTSNSQMHGEGKSDEPETQRSQQHTESIGEEALVDKAEPYSPSSVGSIKDSDCDNSVDGNKHQIKKSILTVNEKETGSKRPKQSDVGISKRHKLNGECDVVDQGGIRARDFRIQNLSSENNHESCSDIHQLDISTNPRASRIVECVFCHSFRSTEASGQMLHLLNGKEVDFDQATQSNVLHVHKKCIDWAPQVYYSGDTVMNLEAELSRASKIKCNSCGLKGAALGCYVKSCKKSFHVPCAYEILECRWDCENYLVLCPVHSSHKLPCDRSKTKPKNKTKRSLYASAPSGDLTSPVTPEDGHLVPPAWVRDWVFCGSALSKEEKCILDELACISEAVVTNLWKPNVTHVIASVDENGGCSRTLKVLLAILTGKWILSIEWVKACIKAGHPVPEEPYEVTHDVHGVFDGPKTGRIRAKKKAAKLFSGFSFYVTDDFQQQTFKSYLEDLIVAGGGNLLKDELMCMHGEKPSGEETDQKVVIVYSFEPPSGGDPSDLDKGLKQRCEKAEALAAGVNGRAIPHTTLLNNIAACHFE